MSDAFVWRGVEDEPYRAYSTAKWFMPPPEDKQCIWRGTDYAQAQKEAVRANKLSGLPARAYQTRIATSPIPKLDKGGLRALVHVVLGTPPTRTDKVNIGALQAAGAVSDDAAPAATEVGMSWLVLHVVRAAAEVQRATAHLNDADRERLIDILRPALFKIVAGAA